jgi:hypothetical protein
VVGQYLITQLAGEAEYEQVFCDIYCNPYSPILTFDDIWVKFYQDMFKHAFFESRSRHKGDKSIFSLRRAERITWIRDTLIDPDAELRFGWSKEQKSVDYDRRIALVRGDYVVVIAPFEDQKARFVTAYVVDDVTKNKILSGPVWQKKER